MIALVIQNDPLRAAATTLGLMQSGFQVMTVESLHAADAMAQIGVVDLLIADERVKGDLTHRLILSAERRNPGVSAILLTDKTGEDADELYLLLPAVYAMLPPEAEAPVVKKFVTAAMAYAGDDLHRRLAEDEVDLVVGGLDSVLPDFEDVTPTPLVRKAPMDGLTEITMPQTAPFQSIRTPVIH